MSIATSYIDTFQENLVNDQLTHHHLKDLEQPEKISFKKVAAKVNRSLQATNMLQNLEKSNYLPSKPVSRKLNKSANKILYF